MAQEVSLQPPQEQRASWLERPVFTTVVLNWERVLFAVILVVAVFTRFYLLENRVMSHDENSHVYYSWLLYRGQGYSHDPVTHGPLQFHLVALSYFLFGDSDFSARIPAVLFSIATVAFMWAYRRYLGKAGALVGALLMVISPYMLYYGRYVRNEAFVALFGVIMLWTMLRYLESGAPRYLIYLTIVTALHFTTKETSFIYQAQALIFLAFLLIYRISLKEWAVPAYRNLFLIVLLAGLLLLGGAVATGVIDTGPPLSEASTELAPATPLPGEGQGMSSGLPLVLAGLGAAALLASLYLLIRGYTWKGLQSERSFDLLVILGTLVLPMLAPFPVKALGINPIDYNNPTAITVNVVFIVILTLLAVGVGLLWNRRLWVINAALFYAIFTVFYTTVFTNGFGFLTGLVGSLGYWLEQQGVNRGNQPFYYYALLQVPFYEFLPLLGTFLAAGVAVFWGRLQSQPDEEPAQPAADVRVAPTGARRVEGEVQPAPVFALLLYWAVTSLAAYTIAGEKMPWLTVHITLPLILLTGWGLGRWIESIDWAFFRQRRGWLVLALLPVFLLSLASTMAALLGTTPPFQGSSLAQLRVTTTFITSLVMAAGSAAALYYLIRPWQPAQFFRVLVLAGFALLAVLTARSAFIASYINYDNAREFLVYAHSAGGVKEALAQIEDISRRTVGDKNIVVAYDNATTYPYWWYLRDYPNQQYYGENPTRALRDVPVILVGDENYGKIEPIVGQAYYQYDYVRLWWPIQDYYDLTWDRIWHAISDPTMRSALMKIWLYRDYSAYGQIKGFDYSLPNWSPAARMRLYVRKDVLAQLWNYGAVPAEVEEVVADPYEGKDAALTASRVIGFTGSEPGQFQRPRDLAIAPDGSLYVADTMNHRIQHLSADGEVLNVWGSFADSSQGSAPPGTFYEPWGIAVGPDGSVYVADTWNHRIQKFTPEGEFITAWGYFGQMETPDAFWGPRDVEVDSQGRVFVTDTGNKRIAIFDAQGNFITQFGSEGFAPGEFSEPVGLAVDADGRVFVADTWNQRIQVLVESADGVFEPQTSWDVVAWYGQSLDNKPYLDVDENYIYATDPEGYRVLQFTKDGEFVRYWGDFTTGADGFGQAGAVAVSPDGSGVWVSDAGNGRVMFFPLEQEP
ncbi:MAG: TIGR03663 family protein [Chloroflexi bacterium]|nr:TIGR03663 family protein [Chloroflexota bacterium]